MTSAAMRRQGYEGVRMERWYGRLVSALFTLFLGFHLFADEPKIHGMQLDEQHRLRIQQVKGDLTISLVTRGRLTDGSSYKVEQEEMFRLGEIEDLARVRSEVLMPAGPNYLNNAGRKYRITIEGLGVAPRYVRVENLDAADARAYLASEFQKLFSRTHGIRREALRRAAVASLDVLNKAGYLPPDLTKSFVESRVSKLRLEEKTLSRKPLERAGGFDVHQNKENYEPLKPVMTGRKVKLGASPK